MPNPYLPTWEYIPDGEPRVFRDRIFIYGSHDRPNETRFCDYKIKGWSAPVDDPGNWTCHGHIFHTAPDRDHQSDTAHTGNELYAPDVVEKDGKYYLFTYIFNAKGCVSVSDRPEGPFRFLSTYQYPEGHSRDDGIFNDPGVLVDDDGRVYIYCGFEKPYMAALNPANMYEVLPGSHKIDVIPPVAPFNFFEASSPRKIGDTYYFIYSPRTGSRLDYATAKSPTGPFTYRGTIIDNGVDYPGGNNHGSLCRIRDQWYIFYHRMTNNTIMSRRACAEPVTILPDGSIPQVEMTSLGFDKALNPFRETPAEWACVLKGGCFVTERTVFERPVCNIVPGSVLGYKYFDFGEDFSSKTMKLVLKVRGAGAKAKVRVMADNDATGEELGVCQISTHDGVYEAVIKNLVGRHAVYFVVVHAYEGWDWAVKPVETRALFELDSFIFLK
jgi:hypothetical protein